MNYTTAFCYAIAIAGLLMFVISSLQESAQREQGANFCRAQGLELYKVHTEGRLWITQEIDSVDCVQITRYDKTVWGTK